MDYNWPEIFKKKTDKELYSIYIGETTLLGEPQKYAEEELKRRKFNFNDLTSFKKKNQLNRLVEEEESLDSSFGRISPERLNMVRNGFFLFFIVCLLIFIFTWPGPSKSEPHHYNILYFAAITAVMTAILHYFYKRELLRRKHRNKKIKALKKELSGR